MIQSHNNESKGVRITFIQPPAIMALDSNSTITQPPIGIAYLAAYARSIGHKVNVLDAVGEAIDIIRPWPNWKRRMIQGLLFEEIAERIPNNTNVIAVSCMFTHAWPMIRELIKYLRKEFPNAKLIAGGEHITAMYDTILDEAPIDVCVLGEGEHTLGDLLKTFQDKTRDYSKVDGIAFKTSSGDIIATKRRKRIMNIDELPWPAWDLLDPVKYSDYGLYQGPNIGVSMPILATRGCPFDCTFCSSANMWSRLWRPRKVRNVLDEMEFYINKYGATDFQFQDLTAIVRKDWIISFCKEILNRKLNITWQLPVGTRSEAIDAEVSEYLFLSGCKQITYAPESASKRILKYIKKRVNLDNLEASVKGSLKAGLSVCLFAIIGFPQEDIGDIKITMKWLRCMARIGVHEAYISTFVPLPGSELHCEIKEFITLKSTDEYYHLMTGATSFFSVKSWNPNISDRKLLLLKLYAFLQFYIVSYYYHPGRIFKNIKNMLLKRQETKVDRVIQEFLRKIPLALNYISNIRKQSILK